MEFIFEILFEMYLELMMFVVPEEKAASRVCRVITVIIALICLIGNLALFILGIGLFEGGSLKGLIPIGLAIALSIAQIVVGFVLHKRRNKQ